jgi:hypothetical protein
MLFCLSVPSSMTRTWSRLSPHRGTLNPTPTIDQHRHNEVVWLNRHQSSVPLPRPAGSASIAFQPDTRTTKSARHSDESDEEQGSQNRARSCCESSGSEDIPASLNMVPVSEIDPYPDAPSPLGFVASLAISSSRDNAIRRQTRLQRRVTRIKPQETMESFV